MKKYILILLFIPLAIRSQNTSDAGMWNTFSIQKSINKTTYIVFDQEFRLRENYSRLNLFYTNLGAGYKISKNFKTELTYRCVQKYLIDNTFSFRHRLMVDFIYKKKFHAISLSNRLRYQTEIKDYLTSDLGKYQEQFLRYKMELKFDIDKKITPFISTEIRYQLDVQNGKRAIYNNEIHRIRYAIGIDYKLKNNNTFSIYYLIQNEFYISSPENNYILGLQYAINL